MKKKASPPPAPATDKTADELNALARQHLTRGQFDDAEQTLLLSLSHAKTADGLRLMGNTLFIKRRVKESLPFFKEALAIDENDHASLAMMAEVLFALGDIQSIAYSMMAINKAPEQHRYKDRFVHYAPHFAFKDYNDFIENAIYECLKFEEVDTQGLQSLWLNTFSLNPRFQPFYRTYHSNDPATRARSSRFKTMLGNYAGGKNDYLFFDAEHFAKQQDLSPLLHPFFLLGLTRLVVPELPFEEFLTALRRRLMDELAAPKLAEDRYILLTSPLAHYCFETEYIFAVTEAEQQTVTALKSDIEAAADLAPLARQISLLSCYMPLHRLKNAEAIARAFAKVDYLAETMQLQVGDVAELRKRAAEIQQLTPIDDATSLKVQAQYEEFPYPRWTVQPKDVSHEGAGLVLLEGSKKILVAGCGTGSEAAQVAVAFPDAKITAIDLSRASLAYGAMKAREFNLRNIQFRQADILKLGAMPEKFDGIFSGGVLHHMADPLQGWKALAEKLNPLGVMRLSLYSETARRHIIKAQEEIRGKYPATPEGMRAFRRDAARILPWEVYAALIHSEDYYQLSMLRDLLFHVQEHRLTLPRLKEMLAALKLAFVKMTVPQNVMDEYKKLYPQDPEGGSLDNWHAFEQRHPDTFLRMYQFWCQKQ